MISLYLSLSRLDTYIHPHVAALSFVPIVPIALVLRRLIRSTCDKSHGISYMWPTYYDVWLFPVSDFRFLISV